MSFEDGASVFGRAHRPVIQLSGTSQRSGGVLMCVFLSLFLFRVCRQSSRKLSRYWARIGVLGGFNIWSTETNYAPSGCLSRTIPDFFPQNLLRVCSFICSQNLALSAPARRIRDVLQPLHDAVIRFYGAAGNVFEMYEHKGDFKQTCRLAGIWTTSWLKIVGFPYGFTKFPPISLVRSVVADKV